MKKPLLLLDIDGVLNVLSDNVGLRSAIVGGYRLRLNPEHKKHVSLFEEKFEVTWSTMWQEKACTEFAPEVGYGHEWPYIPFDDYWNDPELARAVMDRTRHLRVDAPPSRYGVGEYKHPGFTVTVGDRPAVVVDDDLEPWQHTWARERTLSGIPTLTVQPDPLEGLSAEHVDHILAFASTV